MRARLIAILLFGLTPLACTTPPPPVTLNTPGLSISFGMDPDMWAINMAQWAFADAGRIAGKPVEAARAAAALEYLTVALNAPRWQAMHPLTLIEMGQGRAELRQALGIVADAPSQPVISALLAGAHALEAGDHVSAAATFRNPFFTFGAERTLAVLAAMPYLRMANVATMHAGMASNFGGGGLRLR